MDPEADYKDKNGNFIDFYQLLGISPKADASKIQTAYRNAAKVSHPDQTPEDKEWAEEHFKKVNKAYEILMDPNKKVAYDEARKKELARKTKGVGEDPSHQKSEDRTYQPPPYEERTKKIYPAHIVFIESVGDFSHFEQLLRRSAVFPAGIQKLFCIVIWPSALPQNSQVKAIWKFEGKSVEMAPMMSEEKLTAFDIGMADGYLPGKGEIIVMFFNEQVGQANFSIQKISGVDKAFVEKSVTAIKVLLVLTFLFFLLRNIHFPFSIKLNTSKPVYSNVIASPLPYDEVAYTEKVGVLNIESSSVLSPQSGNNYAPQNLVDVKLSTAWCEGVTGCGDGQWVRINFASPKRIKNIYVFPGYAKSQRIFYANNRLKKIQISLSDGSKITADFQDKMCFQKVCLPQTITTSYILLTILEVYKGSTYDDTAISEFQWEEEGAQFFAKKIEWLVIAGCFQLKKNAELQANYVARSGFSNDIDYSNNYNNLRQGWYMVVTRRTYNKKEALTLCRRLKTAGIDAYVTMAY